MHTKMKSALLVVENPATRLLLLRILGRYGWWVDAVDSVEAGLAMLDETPRDVALIDWHIAEGSGLSLLMAMRSHPIWEGTPVVIMHRGIPAWEMDRAFGRGANDFLPKPFTRMAALKTLGRWVIDRAGPAEREWEGNPASWHGWLNRREFNAKE